MAVLPAMLLFWKGLLNLRNHRGGIAGKGTE